MSGLTFARKYGITCEIRPTPRQAEFLQKNFGCVRKVYNLLVEEGNKRDAAAAEWHAENPEERDGQTYPYTWITEAEYKEEHPYLKEADAHALQQARTAYFTARERHFEKGAGRPRYKSKWRGNRTYTTINDDYKHGPSCGYIRVYERNGKGWLRIPKLPKNHVHNTSTKTGKKLSSTHLENDDIRIILPARLRRLLSNPVAAIQIREATLGWRPDGSYYVSLHITEHVKPMTQPDELPIASLTELCFGGDLGLKTFLTGTDGISYDDPSDYANLEKKLHREQRKLGKQQARLKKQGRDLASCKNYQKQKKRVAKIYRKIANKREDFRHKLSRLLVDSFAFIVLEDLNVRGMLKNHCLARGVSESAWSDFVHKVQYKAAWAGKTIVLVDRWFASTSTCSCCGSKSGPRGYSDLGVREWVCPECGATLDRDLNAAWNVLFEGLRVASVDDEGSQTVWFQVFELLRSRFEAEVHGWVASTPTDGTSGVAWVDGVGVGSTVLVPDSGVYTEHGGGSRLVARALGEPEVSRKSKSAVRVSQ